MLDMILIRSISILLVIALRYLLPDQYFKTLFISLLFGHYFLSFYYAKKQLKNLMTTSKFIVPLLVFIAASICFFVSGYYTIAFIPFIAFHVAMSETYMINDNLGTGLLAETPRIGHLNTSRFLLNFILIITLMHDLPMLKSVPVTFLHGAVAVSIAYFLAALFKILPYLSKEKCKTILSYELTGFFFAYLLYFSKVPMVQQYFVLYHVTTWLLFPSMKFIRKENWQELKNLILMVLGSTLFFFLLTFPILNQRPFLALDLYVALWASVHFLATFVMSRLNPKIIRDVFYH